MQFVLHALRLDKRIAEALIARMPPPPLPRTRKTPVTRAIDRLEL